MFDDGDQVTQAPLSEDWGLNRAQVWDLKLCWLPKTCFLTGQKLCGKRAYRGIRFIHGPGEPIEKVYWIEKNEYLIWILKGKK
jgi:hypothetical protein